MKWHTVHTIDTTTKNRHVFLYYFESNYIMSKISDKRFTEIFNEEKKKYDDKHEDLKKWLSPLEYFKYIHDIKD